MQTILERSAELHSDMEVAMNELLVAEAQLREAEPEYLDAAGLKYLGAWRRFVAVKQQIEENTKREPEPKTELAFGISEGGGANGESESGEPDGPVGILFLRSAQTNRARVHR